MNGLTFYDAFAGIGGFRLGLERAGFKCVGSCETDKYARQVYYKNFGEWPDGDIRTITSIRGADMLCGGFPCQDISLAGKGTGISGERSGLWWELARIITICVPRLVFLENVPALTTRGLGDLLGFLADSGYNAEWDCIPASAFGAPHRRDRLWIVAHADSTRRRSAKIIKPGSEDQTESCSDVTSKSLAYTPTMFRKTFERFEQGRILSDHVCYAENEGREDAGRGSGKESKYSRPSDAAWWAVEPDVDRVAHGVPKRMDRLKCLGNAVVPQVVEWIAKRIIKKQIKAKSEVG